MTAGSRLCKWPTGQDLDLDYNSRVGRVDRDVFLEFQLNANYVAKSIISDSDLVEMKPDVSVQLKGLNMFSGKELRVEEKRSYGESTFAGYFCAEY